MKSAGRSSSPYWGPCAAWVGWAIVKLSAPNGEDGYPGYSLAGDGDVAAPPARAAADRGAGGCTEIGEGGGADGLPDGTGAPSGSWWSADVELRPLGQGGRYHKGEDRQRRRLLPEIVACARCFNAMIHADPTSCRCDVTAARREMRYSALHRHHRGGTCGKSVRVCPTLKVSRTPQGLPNPITPQRPG